MGSTGPGEEEGEHALELLEVNAILLQVRQAGVVPLRGVAVSSPVAAGQVFCLNTRSTPRDCQHLWEQFIAPRD